MMEFSKKKIPLKITPVRAKREGKTPAQKDVDILLIDENADDSSDTETKTSMLDLG